MIKINQLVNIVGMPTLSEQYKMFAVDNNDDLNAAVKAYGILVNAACNVEKATNPPSAKQKIDEVLATASDAILDAVATSTKPVATSTKPVATSTKPVATSTKPVATSTKPVSNPHMPKTSKK